MRAGQFPVGASVTLAELESEDAATALARLRATEPVSWLPAFDGWLVTGYQDAVAVLQDVQTFTVDDPRFSTAQVVGASMLSTDGAAHRRHRSPFADAFRPAQVGARFGATVTSLAEELVEQIRPAEHADLRAEVAGPLSVGVVAAALGVPTMDARVVLGWYGAIVRAVSSISAGCAPDAAASVAMAELDEAIRASLAPTSLLGSARTALADEEIVSNAAVMMFGGIETTEAMISSALVHVLGTPRVREQVAADDALRAAAVEESLRLEPAAAVVDRYATRDVTVGGAAVARGELVRVSIAGANRDPAVFADPDRFDPHRPNVRSHLAFARGPHVCLAMDLARLETRIALRTVLDRLPQVRLVAPAPVRGLVFRKPLRVAVTWINVPGAQGDR